MESHSHIIAERFKLNLTPNWCRWFDVDAEALSLPGLMNQPVDLADLASNAPMSIWPGFMLPDTVPLIGNGYGDWICARVTESGEFGELIYWYHGGGDWIPVGGTMAEALLHDAVDQARSVRSQTLRGATEFRGDAPNEAAALNRPFLAWLVENLPSPVSDATTAEELERIGEQQRSLLYTEALGAMHTAGWARDAVACDSIEEWLKAPIEPIADSQVAEAAGIQWHPDFIRILFDPKVSNADTRQEILNASDGLHEWPEQPWQQVADVAREVCSRRDDLGWAFTVAGWERLREGSHRQALDYFWHGRMASTFAEQSIRINSHCHSEVTGKFALDQLLLLREYWGEREHSDPYLSLYASRDKRSLLSKVYDYWSNLGEQAMREERFADAYEAHYRAGWDLGVSRLGDYVEILERLALSARAAGWQARANVAETHLACLKARTR